MRMPLLPLALLACCSCLSPIHAQSTTPNDVLVERLHRNSSLYKDYDIGENLRAKAKRIDGDVSHQQVVEGNPVSCFPECPPDDPYNDPWIKRSVSGSDIIAIGKVTQTVSAFTPKEAFIFSDAQFIPESVWHQSMEQTQMTGDMTGKEVTVTFPGGHLELDGRKFDVNLTSEPALKTGRTYLLFLEYVPESRSYSLSGVRGFDITEPTVKLISTNDEFVHRPIMSDKAGLLEAVRNIVDRAKLEAQK